jgi:broad specificity phosphatase PhoE
VWVFTHQAVIMSFRYLLEALTEQDVLAIDASTPLANCSLTVYRPGAQGELELVEYGAIHHLERSGAQPTREEPRPAAPSARAGDGS